MFFFWFWPLHSGSVYDFVPGSCSLITREGRLSDSSPFPHLGGLEVVELAFQNGWEPVSKGAMNSLISYYLLFSSPPGLLFSSGKSPLYLFKKVLHRCNEKSITCPQRQPAMFLWILPDLFSACRSTYIYRSFSHTQYLVLFINNIESLPKLEG